MALLERDNIFSTLEVEEGVLTEPVAEDNVFSTIEIEEQVEEKEEEEEIPVETTAPVAVEPTQEQVIKPVEDDNVFSTIEVEESDTSTVDPTKFDTNRLYGKASVEEYADSPIFMKKLSAFMTNAFGEKGQQQEDESNRDYVERWLTEKRAFENNSLYMAPQLDWLRTASQEERENFWDIWTDTSTNMAHFYEKGGGDTKSALFDFAIHTVADPAFLLSLLLGKLAVRGTMETIKQTLKYAGREAALQQAKNIVRKNALKEGVATGIFTATEVGLKDLGLQRIAQADKKEDEVEYDYARAGQMAGLGFGIGSVAGGASGYLGSRSISKQVIQIDDMARQAAGKRLEDTKKALMDKENKTGLPEDTPSFDPIEGEKLIEELAKVKSPELLRGSLKTDLHKRMNTLALNIVEQQQLLGKPLDINLNEKASEVVRNILLTTRMGRDSLGKETGQVVIDSDVLEGALTKVGLTEQQFINIAGKSISDSGADLSAYSQFGKWLVKNRKIDPDLDARLKALNSTKYKKTVGYLGKVYDIYRRADRERRAAGVIAPSTTWGNIITSVITAPIRAVTNFVESALYHSGKTLYRARKGEFTSEDVGIGLKEMAKDSFGLLYRLARPIESAEISQRILAGNKSLLYQIERSIADASGDQAETLSSTVRFLNSLNMIQDVYVRRAVFSYSLDKQLRRQGKKIEDALVGNEGVPVAMLKNAVDDSMKATFSYMPRFGESQSVAGVANSAGYAMIKISEAVGPVVPIIGTADNAYPRFFVNALAFNLAHSPISMVDGATNLFRGITKKHSADIVDAQKKLDINPDDIEATILLNDARDKIAKAVVGTSLIYASYKYRIENQDIEPQFIKNSSGFLSDMSKYIPLVPFLQVGDLFAKWELGTLDKVDGKELIKNFAGTRLRNPISFAAFDDLREVLESSGEEGKTLTGERVGEMLGDWTVRTFNLPLAGPRFLSDIWAQIDEDEALARDRKQLEGVGGLERFGETVKKGTMYTLPLFKQLLPEAEDPTREATRIKQAPIYRALFGVSTQERTSDLEKELVRLGIKSYELVPRMKDGRAKALVKREMGVLMEGEFTRHINSDYYKKLSDSDKKISFDNKLKTMRKLAKEYAQLKSFYKSDATTKIDPFNREAFVNLPKKVRQYIDVLFASKYNGKTVLDVQAENRNTDIFGEALKFVDIIKNLQKTL